MIWKKTLTLEQINQICHNTAIENLGITFTAKGDNWLEARMIISEKSCQPMGYLHGGISATLAESVGSLAGYCCVDDDHIVLGAEINASHMRPAKKGQTVTARATPLRLGNTLQVWNIDIHDEQQQLCCCARLTVAIVNKKRTK